MPASIAIGMAKGSKPKARRKLDFRPASGGVDLIEIDMYASSENDRAQLRAVP